MSESFRPVKSYELPFNIYVSVYPSRDSEKEMSGVITSGLKAQFLPDKDKPYYHDDPVDQSNATFVVDAIEATVLAHACAGVDIGSEEYKKGLMDAVHAIAEKVF